MGWYTAKTVIQCNLVQYCPTILCTPGWPRLPPLTFVNCPTVVVAVTIITMAGDEALYVMSRFANTCPVVALIRKAARTPARERRRKGPGSIGVRAKVTTWPVGTGSVVTVPTYVPLGVPSLTLKATYQGTIKKGRATLGSIHIQVPFFATNAGEWMHTHKTDRESYIIMCVITVRGLLSCRPPEGAWVRRAHRSGPSVRGHKCTGTVPLQRHWGCTLRR